MPVPSTIADLSTTPALNSPAGTESPNTADDYLRTLSAFIKQINDASATVSGTQTLTNKTLTNMVFSGSYTEGVYTITDGAGVDLNPSNGTIQVWTLGANRTPTASSFAAGQSMTLLIDDGTAFTITWPSVTWKTNSGSAPTLNTTGYTVVTLWKVGSTLYGARVGNA